MPPFLTLGLGALSGLLSLFGGQKRLSSSDIQGIIGPEAIASGTENFFSLLNKSPQAQSILNSIAVQGQGFGQQIRGNIARAGINPSQSGVASIASAGASSSAGFNQQNFRGSLFGLAGQLAQSSAQSELAALTGQESTFAGLPTSLERFLGSASLGIGNSQILGSLFPNGGGRTTSPDELLASLTSRFGPSQNLTLRPIGA